MKRTGSANNVAMGMAIGAAAAAVGVGLMNTNKRQLKKTANKAMKTMGSLVNDVSSMMR